MEIDLFKQECINLDPDIVVQKHLIDGTSYYFDSIKIGDEFNFKKEIANILNVHIRDIVIVGSGKLGFSMKPDTKGEGLYLFKKFDEAKKSDLDIAIVSSHFFDKAVENLYIHFGSYKNSTWAARNDFAKYILKGRFVIRFLPIDFHLSKEIKLVQEKYKMNYAREINLEIYKSWFFFETYHKSNVIDIKVNLLR